MSPTSRVVTPIGLTLTCLVVLTGCGTSTTTSATPTSASTTAAGSPTGAATDVPSGLPSGAAAQLAKVQQCLDAAGIDVPTPSPPAGGDGVGGSFTPPSGGLNDPQVSAALEACGISLPTQTGPLPTTS